MRPTTSFQATDAGHRAMPKAAAQGGKKKKKKRRERERRNVYPRRQACAVRVPFVSSRAGTERPGEGKERKSGCEHRLVTKNNIYNGYGAFYCLA